MRKAILMMLLAVMSNSAVAEWVEIGETENGKVFSYDPTRIVSLSDGKVKVWYKNTWSAQLKIAEIELLARQLEDMGAGGRESAMLARGKIPSYKNYSHTLHRTIFDCRRQKYFNEEWIDYSTDGRVLERLNVNSLIADVEAAGVKVNSETFLEIYPDTYIEDLMKIVCK